MAANQPSSAPGPRLKRVLGLPALVLYGIILIQPTAPMPLFGVAHDTAHGHVVTLILIGMVAMLFTAFSYGHMANAYPSAGSAYAYVSREIHPAPGYLTGWSMMFDYVMNPIICVIWCAKATMDLGATIGAIHVFGGTIDLGMLHHIRIEVWFVFYACLFTGLNLRGIEASTRTNAILAAGLGVVIVVFFYSAIRYLVQNPPPDAAALARPFYDPATFSFKAISHGPALALLFATFGSGMGAHLGAGRLLYGMGRDNAIPAKFFGYVNPRTRIPSNNIILVGVITLVMAYVLDYNKNGYDLGAQLLNFGALFGFMGVNLSALIHYYVRGRDRRLRHLIPPILGFLICLYLWVSLARFTLKIGVCWLIAGVLYGAWRTSFFTKPLQFAPIDSDDGAQPKG